MKSAPNSNPSYEKAIADGGLRMTAQRREVFDVLLSQRDHPTANEVFFRVKERMPTISLATVYNCLETLVACGLVRQVHIDREPTRYCPNLHEHGHFICTECGEVTDVELEGKTAGRKPLWKLPAGYSVTSVEINLRGLCAKCTNRKN